MLKPPALGHIKVNVDGYLLGSSGRGGIGGIFRNSKRKTLLPFSKEVWVDSTVHVEVLTLRERLLVAVATR